MFLRAYRRGRQNNRHYKLHTYESGLSEKLIAIVTPKSSNNIIFNYFRQVISRQTLLNAACTLRMRAKHTGKKLYANLFE